MNNTYTFVELRENYKIYDIYDDDVDKYLGMRRRKKNGGLKTI